MKTRNKNAADLPETKEAQRSSAIHVGLIFFTEDYVGRLLRLYERPGIFIQTRGQTHKAVWY